MVYTTNTGLTTKKYSAHVPYIQQMLKREGPMNTFDIWYAVSKKYRRCVPSRGMARFMTKHGFTPIGTEKAYFSDAQHSRHYDVVVWTWIEPLTKAKEY